GGSQNGGRRLRAALCCVRAGILGGGSARGPGQRDDRNGERKPEPLFHGKDPREEIGVNSKLTNENLESKLKLSDPERAMLSGEHGPAAQPALSIVVPMAEVYGTDRLMDISHAHVDSAIYLGDATLEFAERLAALGARVAVPTSLNVSGVDQCGWRNWA